MSIADRPTIGWIGVGRMGAALVTRLLDAGHDVIVYNRTRAKALALDGARVAGTITELAGADVVFMTVASSEDLAEVAAALLENGTGPRYLVDCSTVSAEVSARVRRLAEEAGSCLLAAPISGNPKAVTAGRATFVVSGPRQGYEAITPILDVLGAAATYVGEGELARFVKLCHNIHLGVVAESLAEITVLAEKAGVSRAAFLGFLNDSVLGSTFSRYKSPAMVNLDFTPTFTMALLSKDLDLGLAEARRLEVPLPLAAATHELVQEAVGAGRRDDDFAALLGERARGAALPLVPEDEPVSDGLDT